MNTTMIYPYGTAKDKAMKELEEWCSPMNRVDWEAVLVEEAGRYYILVDHKR